MAPIAAAVESGRLLPRARSPVFETAPEAPDETPVRLSMPGGQCIFFDRDPAHCRVHGSLGHGALPLACRQFPRITVQDPRGASVTLSHYCPTAAELLESDYPVTVLDQSPGASPQTNSGAFAQRERSEGETCRRSTN